MHQPVYAEPLEEKKVKLCTGCKNSNEQEWELCAWCDIGGEG